MGFRALKQSSKKTNNVQDPNLGMKMSELRISVNNSELRMIFSMIIVLKLLFIRLWLIAINLYFIFSKEISQISINGLYFWSQPKMFGFLQNNVQDHRSQDPNFLELCLKISNLENFRALKASNLAMGTKL
jgi:hypothetical protein